MYFSCSEVNILALIDHLDVYLHYTDFLVESAQIISESFIDAAVIEVRVGDFIDLANTIVTYSSLSSSEVHLEFR